MNRPRHTWLPPALALALAATPAPGAEERPQAPIEVYEWSVWVGSPAQASLNASRAYRNAMPASVGTSRPKAEGAELAGKFPVAPVSVVQVFGEPIADVDFDLRIKKGTILAHWPRGTERSGRLQWFKSGLTAAVPAGFSTGNLPEDHWFQRSLRKAEGALYLKHETRVERFLAFDVEQAMPIPVKVRGGPDQYTLQNLTGQKLVDVAVIAPVEGGFRVGWLDALPSAVPAEKPVDELAKGRQEKAKAKEKERPEAKAKAADAVFEAADAEEKEARRKVKDQEKKAEVKPLPPEGDADIRARVDQALNRSVNVNVGEAPRKDLLGLVAGQARFRYEVDEPTLAKAEVDLAAPMTMKSGSLAARDALAEILGAVGLSYRVSDDGSLFVTTAARLAEESGKKGKVIEGPPVKLTLAPPLKPADPSYREATRDSLARRLAAQGMRREVVEGILDQYAGPLFEPGGLIVLAHLSREGIEEAMPLDVFPAPKKLARSVLVVSHGVDPRLQDQARVLVKRLGDDSPKARDSAEADLAGLGAVAVPALEDALREKDLEIVLRAERLLMRLNRQVP
jgi:hypothetical protein